MGRRSVSDGELDTSRNQHRSFYRASRPNILFLWGVEGWTLDLQGTRNIQMLTIIRVVTQGTNLEYFVPLLDLYQSKTAMMHRY